VVTRQPRVDTCACQAIPNFFNLEKKDFWKFGKWARAFERMGVQHPHYLKLGSANSSKIHGEWRFHFYPKKIFLNLENTWTFISPVVIFVS
jgi:hypothetical protein